MSASTVAKWPAYPIGPQDNIVALGIIALNYGQLESALRCLFSVVTIMNERQVAALFYRIPNNTRQDALTELMAQTVLAADLKALVRHFCDGFKVCAENRHAIMHSHSGGMYTSKSRNERGILLSKFSKSGKTLVCPASLAELRAIADDIHAYAIFGLSLSSHVRAFWAYRRKRQDEQFMRTPLPEKPPLPIALSWRAPKDVLIDPSQPEPSKAQS